MAVPCHVPPRDASVPERDARDRSGGVGRPPFTFVCRARASIRSLWHAPCETMAMEFYLPDAGHVADAAALIATFGDGAALEAAIRAGRSRDLGNHLHFCRWRQVERLIELLAADGVRGTVH